MAREIVVPLVIPAVLPLGTGAADLLTNLIMQAEGEILDWAYVTDVVGAGVGATQTVNLEIGAVDVTGSATAIALADTNALGEVKELGAPTALNKFRKGDTLSIETAGGTAFTAGRGAFVIWLKLRTRGI